MAYTPTMPPSVIQNEIHGGSPMSGMAVTAVTAKPALRVAEPYSTDQHPVSDPYADRVREGLRQINAPDYPAGTVPPMPRGVHLLRWEPKLAPVALIRVGIVTNVPKFVTTTLLELKAAIAGNRWQSGHWSVRELVDRLEQCGVLVEVDDAAAQ
jgi:hypothetical protein